MEALKKKFEDFQTDIAVNKARLDGINDLAEAMINEGHTDSGEIQLQTDVSVVSLHHIVVVYCYWYKRYLRT